MTAIQERLKNMEIFFD